MTLQAHQLACARGARLLFSDLSFELLPGEAMRVGGSNGSGKTSLLRMLCGLACPSAGEVRWLGANVRLNRAEFNAALLYLGHLNGVKDDLAAWENVMVAATLAGHPVGPEAAYAALDALGLGELADLPTRVLSQGQRKRVALARLQLCTENTLWILDEPFTALDHEAVDALCATLGVHLARGGMLVYTTHQDVSFGRQRLLCMDSARELPC